MRSAGWNSVVIGLIRMVLAIVLGTAALPACAQLPEGPLDRLTLVVPGTAGGGWDLTAKAMKAAIEREGLVRTVDIVRLPGAGGLVGLSQFVARYKGREDALLVGGLVMLGGTIRDEAAITLRDVTPIARLSGEWSVIAVPANSSIGSVQQLRDAMIAQPGQVRWAGGAMGGPDQGLVTTIASRLHVPADDVTYYARSGGKRVAETLLTGRSDLGVSGYAEFAPFIATRELRILAVAAPNRLPGIDAPTLRESGLDATMMNWRGVFAAPGLTDEQQAHLSRLMASLRATPAWQQALRDNRWTDTFLDAASFSQFIDREQNRWLNIIEVPESDGGLATASTRFSDHVPPIALILGAAGVVLGAGMAVLSVRQQRTARAPLVAEFLSVDPLPPDTSASTLVKDEIQQDFGAWNLSFAERDIAWFMLRGLPLKEIAGLRGTSERTVRQQAQAIYRKAGLEGRSDLAGRVLERFI